MHFGAAAITLAAFSMSLSGMIPDTPIRSAAVESERGDYIPALETYLRLLDTDLEPRDFEAIALQTGELYRTTEITTDGSSPRFSPDGRTLLYEAGSGSRRVIRILPADGTTTAVTELAGFGPVFLPTVPGSLPFDSSDPGAGRG